MKRSRRSDRLPRLEHLEDRQLLTVLPEGFVDVEIAAELAFPAALEVDPAGRLYFLESGNGHVRVIEDGVLRPDPILSVPVDIGGERGLFAFAFTPGTFDDHDHGGEDPPPQHHLYAYYTARPTDTQPAANRVSRFHFDPTTATVEAASEEILIQFDPVDNYYHNGGGLAFGPDGMLYIGVGDNQHSERAQSLDNLFGKVLRLNPDGSIPADNPLVDQTTGRNQAIWAYGLRNPFSLTVHTHTGEIDINDVGNLEWEEVNRGYPGGNYGWPVHEGPAHDPAYIDPVYAYPHDPFLSPLRGSAITSSTYYVPDTPQFPSTYEGSLFITDYVFGIQRLDPASGSASWFAIETAPLLVDVTVAPDGSLYYLSFDETGFTGIASATGSIHQIRYVGSAAPEIARQPRDAQVPFGEPATFEVVATGPSPYYYQWLRDGVDLPGATESIYTLASPQLEDDGALFQVLVRNDLGVIASRAALLSVASFPAPTVTIEEPADGLTWKAGDTVSFSARGVSGEGEILAPSALTWQVDFHHDTHLHPFLPPRSGDFGLFTIPTAGETDDNVWYRIHVIATDRQGLRAEATRDIFPRKSQVTLQTSPAGLDLTLDGRAAAATHAFTGVVGVVRSLAAPAEQTFGGITWAFDAWADGGPASRIISAAEDDATYTAIYKPASDTFNPTIDLAAPTPDLTWRPGQPIPFAATATDADGDPLPASAFTWRFELHQEDRISPIGTPLFGVQSGSFTAPSSLPDDPSIFLRLRVTVVDAFGLRSELVRDLSPDTGLIRLQTEPAGLTLRFDADNVLTPWQRASIVGSQHTVEAPAEQLVGGVGYLFDGWADGGDPLRQLTSTDADLALTARYRVEPPPPSPPPPPPPPPPTRGDYGGDRRADLAAYRPATPAGDPPAFVFPDPEGDRLVPLGRDGDIPLAADYDGDGKADIALFRPNSDLLPGASHWFILGSEVGAYSVLFGGAGLDLPAPADYDGDGKADIAVFRPDSDLLPGASEFYILGSKDGPIRTLFGKAGDDVPVPADYDGDGRADLAVYRPDSDLVAGAGHFFALRSTEGAIAFPFGAPNRDVPVPADYDGDGRADFAVYRPDAGLWFLLASTEGASVEALGAAGDVPAQADYDGDGQADLAAFHPADARLTIRRSADQTTVSPTLGQPGDIPVLAPLPYHDTRPGSPVLASTITGLTPPRRRPFSWLTDRRGV